MNYASDQRAELATRIKEKRQEVGISQYKLALLSGINSSRISKAELAKYVLSDLELKKIANVFDVSVQWLRTGREHRSFMNVAEAKKCQLASRIRGRRRFLGMTQAEFQKAANIKSFVLTRIESGQRGITECELETIANALGVSVEWLETGRE